MTRPDSPAADGLARFDTDGLVQSLIRGKQRAASLLVDRWIERGFDYEAIAVSGIQPALYLVGELWAAGRISVAQEHLATAICEGLLMRAYEAAEFAEPREERALFACVRDNHHALGLRIVSDTFAIDGWRVEYLGANVPTEEIVRHVEATRPDFVGLSVSADEQIDTANEVMEQIRASLGEDAPRIAVGGRPILELPRAGALLGDAAWPVHAGKTKELL